MNGSFSRNIIEKCFIFQPAMFDYQRVRLQTPKKQGVDFGAEATSILNPSGAFGYVRNRRKHGGKKVKLGIYETEPSK